MVDNKNVPVFWQKYHLKKTQNPQYKHSQINIKGCQSQISICGISTLAVVV